MKKDDRSESAHAAANARAHALWLNRIGNPVAASPRNVVNSTACKYLCSRVNRMKNRSGVAPCYAALVNRLLQIRHSFLLQRLFS